MCAHILFYGKDINISQLQTSYTNIFHPPSKSLIEHILHIYWYFINYTVIMFLESWFHVWHMHYLSVSVMMLCCLLLPTVFHHLCCTICYALEHLTVLFWFSLAVTSSVAKWLTVSQLAEMLIIMCCPYKEMGHMIEVWGITNTYRKLLKILKVCKRQWKERPGPNRSDPHTVQQMLPYIGLALPLQ